MGSGGQEYAFVGTGGIEFLVAVALVIIGAGTWTWIGWQRQHRGNRGGRESSLPGASRPKVRVGQAGLNWSSWLGTAGLNWSSMRGTAGLHWLAWFITTTALIMLLRTGRHTQTDSRPALGRDIHHLHQHVEDGWRPALLSTSSLNCQTTDGWAGPFHLGVMGIRHSHTGGHYHAWLQERETPTLSNIQAALRLARGGAAYLCDAAWRGAVSVLFAERSRLRQAQSFRPFCASASEAVVRGLCGMGCGMHGMRCRPTVQAGCEVSMSHFYPLYQLIISAVRTLAALAMMIVSAAAMEIGVWVTLAAAAIFTVLTSLPLAEVCRRAVEAVRTIPNEMAVLSVAAVITAVLGVVAPLVYTGAAMLLWVVLCMEAIIMFRALRSRTRFRRATHEHKLLTLAFVTTGRFRVGRWRGHTRVVRVPVVPRQTRTMRKAMRCPATCKVVLHGWDIAAAACFRRHVLKHLCTMCISTVSLAFVVALTATANGQHNIIVGILWASAAVPTVIISAWATLSHGAYTALAAAKLWLSALPTAFYDSLGRDPQMHGLGSAFPATTGMGVWVPSQQPGTWEARQAQLFDLRQLAWFAAVAFYAWVLFCSLAQWCTQSSFSLQLIRWERGWSNANEAAKRIRAWRRGLTETATRARAERRQARVDHMCFMAKDDTDGKKFEGMGNLQGMALRFQIDDFIDDCLERDGGKPMDEEFYVRRFLTICGKGSPVGLCVTTTVTNDELRNQSPKEHALQLSRTNRLQHAHKVELSGVHSSPVTTALKAMVDNAYPEYEPDAQDLADLQFWEEQAQSYQYEYQEVVAAQEMLNELRQRMQQQQQEHEARNLWSRWSWLQSQPQHVAAVAWIERHLKTIRDTMGESERKHAHYADRQFHEAEDFGALMWLRDYVVRAVGAINVLHVDVWRETRMASGQTPAQAFADLLKEGLVLRSVRIPGFHLDTELLQIITTKDLPRGPFFPPALYEDIETRVRTYLDMSEHIGNDPMRTVQAWVDAAQKTHYGTAQYNRTLHEKILAQLVARGTSKPWDQRIQDMLSRARKAAKDDRKGGSSDPATTNPADKDRGKLWCEHHGHCGHTTEQCRGKKRAGEGKPNSEGSPAAAMMAAIDELRKVMTTTLAPGQSPLQAGMRPGARYGQNVEKEQPGQTAPAVNHNGVPQCHTCTKIAGVPQYHKGECFCKDTPAPDWFRPRNRKIWEVVNQIRVKHGKTPLPEPAPPTPPRRTAAMATEVPDPGAGGASSSSAAVVSMMHLGQPPRESLAAKNLRFDEHTSPPTFFCIPCGHKACEVVQEPTGALYQVHCVNCRSIFNATHLPAHWAHHTLWTHDRAAAQPSPALATPGARAGFGSLFEGSMAGGPSPAAPVPQLMLPLRGVPPKPPTAAPRLEATASNTYLGVLLDSDPALADCCHSMVERNLDPVMSMASLVRHIDQYPCTAAVEAVAQAVMERVPVAKQPLAQLMWKRQFSAAAGAARPQTGHVKALQPAGVSAATAQAAAAPSGFAIGHMAAEAPATYGYTGLGQEGHPAPTTTSDRVPSGSTSQSTATAPVAAAPQPMPSRATVDTRGMLSQTAALLQQLQRQAEQVESAQAQPGERGGMQPDLVEELRTQVSEIEGKVDGLASGLSTLSSLVAALSQDQEQQLGAGLAGLVAQIQEQVSQLRSTSDELSSTSAAQAATSLSMAQSLQNMSTTYAGMGVTDSLHRLISQCEYRIDEVSQRSSRALTAAQSAESRLSAVVAPAQQKSDREAVAHLRTEMSALRGELAEEKRSAAQLRTEMVTLEKCQVSMKEGLKRQIENVSASFEQKLGAIRVSAQASGSSFNLEAVRASLPSLNVTRTEPALASEPEDGARKSAKRSRAGTPRSATHSAGVFARATGLGAEEQPTPAQVQDVLAQAAEQLRRSEQVAAEQSALGQPAAAQRAPVQADTALTESEARLLRECGLFSEFSTLTEGSLLSTPRPKASAEFSSAAAGPSSVVRNLDQVMSAADEEVPTPPAAGVPSGVTPRRTARTPVLRYPSMSERAMGPPIETIKSGSSSSESEPGEARQQPEQHIALMMREQSSRDLLVAALAEFDMAAERPNCQSPAEPHQDGGPSEEEAVAAADTKQQAECPGENPPHAMAVRFVEGDVKSDTNAGGDTWPEIDPALCPFIPVTTRAQYKRGSYVASKGEQRLWQHYFGRKATVVTLQQRHPATSLRLFSVNDERVLLPSSVLVDSGASILMLVSPAIATELGLTYEPNSATLVGVGGQGGALGRSRQKIRVCLGGSSHAGDKSVGALQGCFTIWVNPIIMTYELVNRMGYTVVLGAAYLRLCAASFIHLEEKLEIAPALLQHQCPGLRVQLPCTMSMESQHLPPLVASADQDWVVLPDDVRPKSGRTKRQRVRQRAPAPAEPAMMLNECDLSGAADTTSLLQQVATAKFVRPVDLRMGFHQPMSSLGVTHSPDGHSLGQEGWNANSAMLLHPGMPQSEQPPTREQYAAHRARMAQSSAARAEERAAQLNSLQPIRSTELQPESVSYRLEDLRRTGRLREGFVLDLTTPDLSTTAAFQQLRQQLLQQLRGELGVKAAAPATSAVPSEPAAGPPEAAPEPGTPPRCEIEVPARSAPFSTIEDEPTAGCSQHPAAASLPEDPFNQSTATQLSEEVESPAPSPKAPAVPTTKHVPAPSGRITRTRTRAAQVVPASEREAGGVDHPVVLMTQPNSAATHATMDFVKNVRGWRPAIRAMSLVRALKYWDSRRAADGTAADQGKPASA